jgi:hypothetical protein
MLAQVQGLFSLVPVLTGVNNTVAGYETWQVVFPLSGVV